MTTVLDRSYPESIVADIVDKHLRIPTDAGELYDNAVICVRNTFDAAEAYTNRLIVDSLATFSWRGVDSTLIELPSAPIKEIIEVRYRNNGEWKTLSSDDYWLWGNNHRATLQLLTAFECDAFEVSAKCGYDEDGEHGLPGGIRQAVMLMAGTFNSFEGDAQLGAVSEIPMSARYLLSHYRIYPYGG
jgi:uncharacterized phiE125 gp8 family phage protein